MKDLFPALEHPVAAQRRQIRTVHVNDVLGQATRPQAPASMHGKRLRFLYATQTGTAPAAITTLTSARDLVQSAYERCLANQIGAAFQLYGALLRLHFRLRQKACRERLWPARGKARSSPWFSGRRPQ